MSQPRVRIPVKSHKNVQWGQLSMLGSSWDIVGEKVQRVNDKFSLFGQHRVRLYRFKKNVHFKIPEGTDLDISRVRPDRAPRR